MEKSYGELVGDAIGESIKGLGDIILENENIIRRVEDWIAETALKTDGAVFVKDADENQNAQITTGDIRKLLNAIERNPLTHKGEMR